MNAETHLAGAALRLANSHPYLGSALWAMPRVSAQGLGTVAVDARWRLYYDPETIASWTANELEGALYHEVLHLLRDHNSRRPQGSDAAAWNIACDAEINDDLLEEHVSLPGSPVLPKGIGMPDGKLAEEYYLHLAEPSRPLPGSWCGDPPAGVQGWLTEKGLSLSEGALVRRDVARAIVEHPSTRAGRVPGHLSRWAEGVMEPVVDWRKELASVARRAVATVAGAIDYSYRRPSRRHGSSSGIIFPSLVRPIARVAVVADTSGSIGPHELEAVMGEVKGILREVGQKSPVRVMSVDTHVRSSQAVSTLSDLRLEGGGGTDMGAGLRAAEQLKPCPDVVVVLTDGYTPWPATAPQGFKTIIVLLSGATVTTPAWAKTIRRDAA